MNKRKYALAGVLTASLVGGLLTATGVGPASAGQGVNGFAVVQFVLPAAGNLPGRLCTNTDDEKTCVHYIVQEHVPGDVLELRFDYQSKGGTPDVMTFAGGPLPLASGAQCHNKLGAVMTVLGQDSQRSGSVTINHKRSGTNQTLPIGSAETTPGTTAKPGFCI